MACEVEVIRRSSYVKDEDLIPDGFFEQWKNKHVGEPAYVLGSGPTVNEFEPEKHPGIYIGANDIHVHEKIGPKLNYLVTEKNHPNLKNVRIPVFHHECVKEETANTFNCFRNLSEWGDPFCGKFVKEAPRCSHAPLKDFTEILGPVSMIYLSFFFSLYVGCKKIHLVGVDCSSGKFTDSLVAGTYVTNVEVWKRIKEYLQNTDVDVFNINPVNLKEVFPTCNA